MTATAVSICASWEIPEVECTGTVGIDRSLRNVACGNAATVTLHNTNRLLSIKENAVHACAAFRRNDRRKKGQS